MPIKNHAAIDPADTNAIAAADIDTLVVIDKLQLLYRQSLHAVYSAIVAASFWVALMWSVATTNALYLCKYSQTRMA
jgi:hypothetical protein